MVPGDICWVRGTVSQVTPHALLVTFQGPKGSAVTYALDPRGHIEPEGMEPEPAKPA